MDDIDKLYQKNFHAQDAFITIVGDINFETAKKLTQKYFGKWAKGSITPSSFPAPENVAQTQIEFVEMPNAVQSEISVLSTANIDRKNPDYFALTIANQILGGGGEARLFLNLREDKGYTYGSYSRFNINHKTKSQFRAFTAVRNTVTDSAVVELLYEIDRMNKEMVTNEELKLVKEKYAGSLIRSMEDPENIANFAYNTKTQNLPPNFYNNLLKNIQLVTKEDISRVSKKYFNLNSMRVVVTGKGTSLFDSPPLLYIPSDHSYSAQVEVEVSGEAKAGLILFYNYRAFSGMLADKKDILTNLRGWQFPTEKEVINGRVYLKLVNNRNTVNMYYSLDGRSWTKTENSFEASPYHHNILSGFMSLRIGLVSVGDGEVKFKNFSYQPIKE